MASHHFIGTGSLSGTLTAAAENPARLLAAMGELVEAEGLSVVADQSATFDNGGLTLVWVLAESHLVLHVWAQEGFATLDLHVCDYHASNAAKAQRLVASLSSFCFAAAGHWHEVHLQDPVGETA